MGFIPDEPPPGTQQKTLSQYGKNRHDDLRQRIVRLRTTTWQLRSRVSAQRGILRAKALAKVTAVDRLVRAMRLSRYSNKKVQASSEGRTLQELLQDCEKLRDEYGTVEDDCNILENQLNNHEYELQRLEENYDEEFCCSDILHESQPNFDILHKSRTSSDVHPDYHPLVIEYLSKLGDMDILRERLEWHQEEREVLEENQETRKRVNRSLSPDDEAWLDQAEELENVIMKDLLEAEADVEELRKKCEGAGLLDENGMPSDLDTQEQEALVADPELGAKVLKPHSKWGCPSSFLYRLREYSGSIGFCTLFTHFGIANASGTAAENNEGGNIPQTILGSGAPAAKLVLTLGVSVVGAIFVQRRWDADMRLLLNVLLNLGILLLAQDPRFSDGELLVLCLYAAGINLNWMKNKLLRFPKTGGVTALGIVGLASYSGWMITHQFPELEARFNNHLVSKIIVSIPASAGYSTAWVAVFEQTRLAEAIENGVYDSHIWEFIVTFLKTFLGRFFERGIEVFTERMFGYVEASFENNMVRRSAQDVEAGRSAYYPRNDPFRSPGNGNFPRQNNEDGFSDQWSQSTH